MTDTNVNTDENPVIQACNILIEEGFSETEAKNLIGALQANDPDKLIKDLEQWLTYCCELKVQYETTVGNAARGMVNVRYDKNNELTLSLATDNS